MKPKSLVAAVLLASCGPALADVQVDPKLVAAAKAETPRAIGLLERMVDINSGTLNVAGVERVGRIMIDELEALGFEVRWVPMTEVGRAGHVVATHEGTRGKRMLLIGHLDTVFEPSSPFQKFVRRGDVAEGPGVNDMKDGLAIMVSALRAMKAAGTLDDARIRIVLSGDEENAGRPLETSRRDMRAAAEASDVALEFESLAQLDGRDMGSIARRSSTRWQVEVTAKSGHSSGIFSEDAGVGAAYEIARILDAFRRELREPNATYNVGLLASGESAALEGESRGTLTGKENIIPAVAVARGDLRTLSNEQTERVRAGMRRIVEAPLPHATSRIVFEEGYPAMAPTEASRALLTRLNEINAAAGLPIMGELDPLERGAGDIAFVADIVDAGLIGFGAAGEGAHAPGETVDLTSFERQIVRAALMMSDLAR